MPKASAAVSVRPVATSSMAKGNHSQPTASVMPAVPLPFSQRLTQWIVLFFAATLPLYFDLNVPEVSGDIRWLATTVFAGLAAFTLLGGLWTQSGPVKLRFYGPLQLWVAAALALWALISLIDAMNWMRGIILIKALYAQMILLVCVWYVAKPVVGNEGFARKLMWALCAPLAATAFIGILQFHNFTQASFDAALVGPPYILLQSLFGLLGWLLQGVQWITPLWPQTPNLVDQLTGFFLQSAVPGGSFANKNLAGSYTAMMIPLMLYLLLSSRRWWEQALASLLLTLAGVFLIYARARASWLALLAALLVGVVLVLVVPSLRAYLKSCFSWKALAWLLLPVLLLSRHAGDVSPITGAHGITATPAEQLSGLVSASGGWDEFGGRLAYNLNSLVITRDHWFNGVGLGGFMVIWPPYYNAVVTTPTNSYNVMARPQRTHSDPMQAFTEMGVPGGIFYSLLFALGVAAGLRLLGREAGALGGKLIGFGLLTSLLGLISFLHYREIISLPGVWHSVLSGVLGLWLAYVALRVLLRLRQVWQQPAEPLESWRVAGFFTSLGLLCICLNAFMDFPMQLPTAPAAAAMMMGLLLALHGQLFPQGWYVGWPRRSFSVPRRGFLGFVIMLLAALWGLAVYDGLKFKEANTLLKMGMMRLFSGVSDETTLNILKAANNIYGLDPRIHEHLAVVYANYSGPTPIALSTRAELLEGFLQGDPWGANHLINLAGVYVQLVEQQRSQGQTEAANETLRKLDALGPKLMRTADFSHFTWGIVGITRLLQGRPAEAIPLLQRTLVIEPSYTPAQNALALALAQTGQMPVTVQDGLLR